LRLWLSPGAAQGKPISYSASDYYLVLMDTENLGQRVRREFRQRFGSRPNYVVRAPGRVNLIGEHTDYNDGFVLPLAIDRAVWLAVGPRRDRKVSVHSLDFGENLEFDLDGLKRENSGWREYPKGVAWALQEAGHRLQGWQGVLAGDVPIGAGLSSSAALELAVARAFAAVSELPWEPLVMARLGQRAENAWVGVRCGIMDQTVSAAGRAGHALLIDCRLLEVTPVPLPPETTVVVLDTGTRRELADSAYNERRRHCEETARHFGVRALRDISLERFEAESAKLDSVTRRRARHVITENARTVEAAQAMQRADAHTLGALMDASHTSLRDDFAVSCTELDCMVEVGKRHEACFGIRMTGAGFGGCAVALVRTTQTHDFARQTASSYQAATGRKPSIYITPATDGAGMMGEMDE
jgi:galactokinase